MSDIKPRRGRVHDAAGAREAILNAAEKVFAEHGFDGARTDVIAAEAGYNQSLISIYFGGKLGLYDEVIRRVDEQTREIQEKVFTTFVEDETLLNVDKIKPLLREFISTYFDYLAAHPQHMRILLWEMAEGWQTLAKVITQRDREDVNRIKPLVKMLQKVGLIGAGLNPIAQIVFIEFILPCYLTSIPLYKTLLPDEDFASAEALTHAREFVINFIVRGLIIDPSEARDKGQG